VEEFIMGGKTTSLTYSILCGALWNWLSIFLRTVSSSTFFLTLPAPDSYLLST
jgi:hypothetical protein